MIRIIEMIIVGMILFFMTSGIITAQTAEHKDIRNFSEHFDVPGSFGPYRFQASSETFISTAEHPGLLTIYHSGNDKEMKGILNQPLSLADYPPPWECEMDVMHSFWTKCASVQVNLAIGMNVEITFSDPSTWPEDEWFLTPEWESPREMAPLMEIRPTFRGCLAGNRNGLGVDVNGYILGLFPQINQ